MATVGAVSNPDNQNQNLGKAGRNRWMGMRPLTRGVAKNPVDHPHGGGEGRTSGGRHPVTPWGKPTKGARTRHNKSTDKMIIRSRHDEEEGLTMARSVWKGPFVELQPSEEGARPRRKPTRARRSRPGRVARRSCRSSSA